MKFLLKMTKRFCDEVIYMLNHSFSLFNVLFFSFFLPSSFFAMAWPCVKVVLYGELTDGTRLIGRSN